MKRSDESTADWPMTTHTEARQGLIPHLLMTLNGQSFLAPVKLHPMRHLMTELHKPKAVERDGHYVYALPGGKEVRG